MVAWKLVQVSNCQARGQGVLCGGAWGGEFPIRRINPHGTPRKLYATIHQCCILVIAAAMASLLPTTQRFLDLYPFFPCPLRSQHLYTQSTKIGVLRNDILNNYGYYNRKSFSTLPARPLHDSARIRPNPLYVFQLLKRSVSQNLPF